MEEGWVGEALVGEGWVGAALGVEGWVVEALVVEEGGLVGRMISLLKAHTGR